MIVENCVEIFSPGRLRDGRQFVVVCFVEADCGRSETWSGPDYSEAILAAGDCEAPGFPVIDRVVEGHPNAWNAGGRIE